MKHYRGALLGVMAIAFIFISCGRENVIFHVEGKTIILDTVNAPFIDSAAYLLTETYKAALDAEMNQVIGYTSSEMVKDIPQGLLNNFIADLVFEKAKIIYEADDNQSIDFCLLNYGGLRSSLPKGEITLGRVFELMPFDNEFTVITLSGAKTSELFTYLALESNWGMPISGLQMQIKNALPQKVLIQGAPFDPSRNYKIITSDYLAKGGDRMNFFLEPISYESLNFKVRDAIIEYFKEKTSPAKKAESKIDNRITIIE